MFTKKAGKLLSALVSAIIIIVATFCTLVFAPPKATPSEAIAGDSDYVCLGYLPGWSYSGQWDLAKYDFKKVTHVNYAFSLVNTGLIPTVDGDKVRALVNEIRRQGATTKVLVSIGGWGAGNFCEAARDDWRRKKFAEICAGWIRDFGIDGIDVDWEFPGSNAAGISACGNCKSDNTLLMQEIRNYIGPNKLLTIAGGGTREHLTAYLEGYKLKNILDFVNLMNYDYDTNNGASFNKTKAGAAAYAEVFGKKKINIGLPFYAHSYSDAYNWKEYRVLVPDIQNGTIQVSGNDDETWGMAGGSKISFDTPAQLRKKTRWAIQEGYGGVMCWEMSQDLDNDLMSVMHSNSNGDGSYNSKYMPMDDLPPANPFATPNLSVGKAVTASSIETADGKTYPAINAVDGKLDTRWSSSASESQWITVDLGNDYMLYGVRLLWEAAYAKSYRIETATSAAPDSWQAVHTQEGGKGGTESIKLQNPTRARYVRMQGLTRATTYGYSLYEFEVYGHEIKGVPGTFNATEWAAKSDEIRNDLQEGKTFVGQLQNGSWLDYYINVPKNGKYSFNIRGAVGQTATRTLTLTAGETNLGTMNMVVDGSNWFNFSDNKAEFELQAGVQKLHLVANGSINIENITIEAATPPEFKILSIGKSPTPAKRVRTTYTANVQGGEGSLKYNFYIFMGNKLTYFKKDLSVNNFSYVAPKSGNYSVLCICVDTTGKRVMLRDYFVVR